MAVQVQGSAPSFPPACNPPRTTRSYAGEIAPGRCFDWHWPGFGAAAWTATRDPWGRVGSERIPRRVTKPSRFDSGPHHWHTRHTFTLPARVRRAGGISASQPYTPRDSCPEISRDVLRKQAFTVEWRIVPCTVLDWQVMTPFTSSPQPPSVRTMACPRTVQHGVGLGFGLGVAV
jgi:hypothetical protein